MEQTQTNYLRARVLLGFCASMLFSFCGTQVGMNIISTMWFEKHI